MTRTRFTRAPRPYLYIDDGHPESRDCDDNYLWLEANLSDYEVCHEAIRGKNPPTGSSFRSGPSFLTGLIWFLAGSALFVVLGSYMQDGSRQQRPVSETAGAAATPADGLAASHARAPRESR